jgi:hypothetical protein
MTTTEPRERHGSGFARHQTHLCLDASDTRQDRSVHALNNPGAGVLAVTVRATGTAELVLTEEIFAKLGHGYSNGNILVRPADRTWAAAVPHLYAARLSDIVLTGVQRLPANDAARVLHLAAALDVQLWLVGQHPLPTELAHVLDGWTDVTAALDWNGLWQTWQSTRPEQSPERPAAPARRRRPAPVGTAPRTAATAMRATIATTAPAGHSRQQDACVLDAAQQLIDRHGPLLTQLRAALSDRNVRPHQVAHAVVIQHVSRHVIVDSVDHTLLRLAGTQLALLHVGWHLHTDSADLPAAVQAVLEQDRPHAPDGLSKQLRAWRRPDLPAAALLAAYGACEAQLGQYSVRQALAGDLPGSEDAGARALYLAQAHGQRLLGRRLHDPLLPAATDAWASHQLSQRAAVELRLRYGRHSRLAGHCSGQQDALLRLQVHPLPDLISLGLMPTPDPSSLSIAAPQPGIAELAAAARARGELTPGEMALLVAATRQPISRAVLRRAAWVRAAVARLAGRGLVHASDQQVEITDVGVWPDFRRSQAHDCLIVGVVAGQRLENGWERRNRVGTRLWACRSTAGRGVC